MGNRQRDPFLELLDLCSECCLFVVEPVDDEGLVVQRHSGSERDISHWIDGGGNEEATVFIFVEGNRVAPYTAYVVRAVSEKYIRDATSARE